MTISELLSYMYEDLHKWVSPEVLHLVDSYVLRAYQIGKEVVEDDGK